MAVGAHDDQVGLEIARLAHDLILGPIAVNNRQFRLNALARERIDDSAEIFFPGVDFSGVGKRTEQAAGSVFLHVQQVHDDLLFEVPENEIDLMRGLVREKMESVHKLSVPLLVELGVGPNWRDVK